MTYLKSHIVPTDGTPLVFNLDVRNGMVYATYQDETSPVNPVIELNLNDLARAVSMMLDEQGAAWQELLSKLD